MRNCLNPFLPQPNANYTRRQDPQVQVHVREYESQDRDQIERFREQTFIEGNQSLDAAKFNPDEFDGKIWLAYIGEDLASLSAVESSHYTGDPQIAARVCRYHILKRFRHSHCGFHMLPYQIEWARTAGYKILYWTHDIHNKPLNALYQHKRRMTDPQAKQFFEAPWYTQMQLDRRWLFRVSPKSDFLQYVYVIQLQQHEWIPQTNALWYEHDGAISISNKDILDGVNQ